MINPGKKFEQEFKKSVPNEILYERFKDGTATYYGGSNNNIRFQSKNVCDCFMFDGHILIYVELKSHKGKSIPLDCIRENQVTEMLKRIKYMNTYAGIVVNFRDVEKTYWLNIVDYYKFTNENFRKSIPIEYFRDNGILIEQCKKRTSFTYDIGKLVENITNFE